MADSLIIDWLNENELRAYPLKSLVSRVSSGGYTLTDNIVLDAQFVYASVPNPVQLTNIQSTSSDVIFTVTGGITFTASKAATYPLSVRLAQGHLLTVGGATAVIPVGNYPFTGVNFEPSVCFEFGGAWLGVSSLNFGSSLTGNISFLEGYQFSIVPTSSTITFDCGASFGTPISCLTISDIPNDCSSIVSYVNGVAADGREILHFTAGGGVVVLEDPPNHRIFIGLSSDPTTDVCQPIPINPAR